MDGMGISIKHLALQLEETRNARESKRLTVTFAPGNEILLANPRSLSFFPASSAVASASSCVCVSKVVNLLKGRWVEFLTLLLYGNTIAYQTF